MSISVTGTSMTVWLTMIVCWKRLARVLYCEECGYDPLTCNFVCSILLGTVMLINVKEYEHDMAHKDCASHS